MVLDVASLLPEVEIVPIFRIDPRLADLSDRRLVIALHQLGWAGLITNNYRMLNVPSEISAIVRTKLTIIAVRGVGDDPIRATGAVMVDLPAIVTKLGQGGEAGQVFLRGPSTPQAQPPWTHFQAAASDATRRPRTLYEEFKVTDEELAEPVLS